MKQQVRRLFHLVVPSGSQDLPDFPWAPPSLATEGFVHLSYAEQLAGTLSVHFGGHQRLVLLELDPERASNALRVEPSRGGELFPHLYRALEREDVVGSWRLERCGGAWSLPKLTPHFQGGHPPAH